jgi:hypothetical protein
MDPFRELAGLHWISMMNYEDEAISYVYEIVKTVQFELASNRIFRLEV